MASSSYYQAREEFIEGLSHNLDALDKLQKIYKLPWSFSSLKPERTVRALEMIGVFTPESPAGLQELPNWLGMAETYKKIKKILKFKKSKFAFKGCNDLHQSTDMQRLLAEVQYSGRIFLAEIELLKGILETRSQSRPDLESHITSVNELVEDVSKVICGVTVTGNEVLKPSSEGIFVKCKLL